MLIRYINQQKCLGKLFFKASIINNQNFRYNYLLSWTDIKIVLWYKPIDKSIIR